MKYIAFGEIRTGSGTSSTDYLYTGQRNEAETGLYFYKARFYDPALGRFIQPDTLVPDLASSGAYDRYAYVNNNPINFNDPSGNKPCDEEFGCSGKPSYVKSANIATPSPRCIESFVLCMGLPVKNGKVLTNFGHQNTMDYGWDIKIETYIPATKFENGKLLSEGVFTKDKYIDVWGIHAAVDISPTGETTPIFSAYSGTIYKRIESDTNGGNKIIIKHTFGDSKYYSVYLHLKDLNVNEGDHVEKGTQIGAMGDTGSPGLTHLHFEVRTSSGMNNLFAPEWWWANSSEELQSNWIDISSRFDGYDSFYPDDWR